MLSHTLFQLLRTGRCEFSIPTEPPIVLSVSIDPFGLELSVSLSVAACVRINHQPASFSHPSSFIIITIIVLLQAIISVFSSRASANPGWEPDPFLVNTSVLGSRAVHRAPHTATGFTRRRTFGFRAVLRRPHSDAYSHIRSLPIRGADMVQEGKARGTNARI